VSACGAPATTALPLIATQVPRRSVAAPTLEVSFCSWFQTLLVAS
jgi:hypothetical protein